MLQLLVFPPDEWRGTEIEFLGTDGCVSTQAVNSFHYRRGNADPHGPRKIRCREGFGREKVGGECWEVESMESTRMTSPEWLTLGMSWVTALNWLTAVNSQQLLPEVLLLSSLEAVPYHLGDVLHCLFQQLIRLNPLHVGHCGRLQNRSRELKRQKY